MAGVFIHGLESSSRGTKARWFARRFPEMVIPDFSGSLEERMVQLRRILSGRDGLVLVGSSFGGLMAAVCAMEEPSRVERVVLLAPALNFPEFAARPHRRVDVETILVVGRHDTVCPPGDVIPVAKSIFADPVITMVEDDHLLHKTFFDLDWPSLLT
ncbi:MAG: hypothetical protein Kow0089_08380 [Desulfobulbaceae bacterium]